MTLHNQKLAREKCKTQYHHRLSPDSSTSSEMCAVPDASTSGQHCAVYIVYDLVATRFGVCRTWV